MSAFDRDIGGGKSDSLRIGVAQRLLLSQLMTVTFSMQIKLVFTDLPWVYIFPPAGLHWLMMSRRWDQPFSTLMLMPPSHRACSLPCIRHCTATQCFPLCHIQYYQQFIFAENVSAAAATSVRLYLLLGVGRWNAVEKIKHHHDVDSRLQPKVPQCYNRYQWFPSVVVLLEFLQLVSKNVLKVERHSGLFIQMPFFSWESTSKRNGTWLLADQSLVSYTWITSTLNIETSRFSHKYNM